MDVTKLDADPTGCLIRSTPPLKTGLVVMYRPARSKPRKYTLADGVRIVRYIKCSYTDREIICALFSELDAGRLILDLVKRLLGVGEVASGSGGGGMTAEGATAGLPSASDVIGWIIASKELRRILQALLGLLERIKASWLWRIFGKTIIVRLILNSIEGAVGVIIAVLGLFDELEHLIEVLRNLYCTEEIQP